MGNLLIKLKKPNSAKQNEEHISRSNNNINASLRDRLSSSVATCEEIELKTFCKPDQYQMEREDATESNLALNQKFSVRLSTASAASLVASDNDG